MLKTGIYLLSSSSLGVLYRSYDFTYSTNPAIKWLSLAGLIISFVCFVLTYIRAQSPGTLKALVRRSSLIHTQKPMLVTISRI